MACYSSDMPKAIWAWDRRFETVFGRRRLADLPFGVYPFRAGIETRLLEPFMPERYDENHSYDLNVIVVAADQMPSVLNSIDGRLLNNSYNVLQTFWELPKAPKAWRGILRSIDEIWAPNNFVANAFRPLFSGPITLIPPVVRRWRGAFPFARSFRNGR